MNFESVLIVTYGRSGSTLLQGLLNGIPGCVIRGENNNLFYDFFQGYQKLKVISEHAGATLPTNAWYGAKAYKEKDYLTTVSRYIKRSLLADTDRDHALRCYGFKEISYENIIDDLLNYLDFLKKVFPNPAFIFNTRNLDDVCKSGWWAVRDEVEVKAKLTSLENIFSQYCLHNNNGFQLDYEDVVGLSKKFEDLYEFLGVEFNREFNSKILAVPHSYDARQEHVRSLRAEPGREI